MGNVCDLCSQSDENTSNIPNKNKPIHDERFKVKFNQSLYEKRFKPNDWLGINLVSFLETKYNLQIG